MSETGDSGAETTDIITNNVCKTKWSRWCKKYWWTFGWLVVAVMAVALPFVAGDTPSSRDCSSAGQNPSSPDCSSADADCAAYKAAGYTTSGVYTLGQPLSGVTVYCDMDIDIEGGWTVIQRRLDGSVPFDRTWQEYKRGFGNKNGEYWLGNENIHLLTTQKDYHLRIDMLSWDRRIRYAKYYTFRVAGESNGYRLTVSGYSGTAGDSMRHNNGQMFSTVDRDNDVASNLDCSQQSGQGGWWYKDCSRSFLNGRYVNLRNCGNSCRAWPGVVWYDWRGGDYSLKSVSMKIRPKTIFKHA
ncbi:PREDICTED: microfibril-associated glycoprotein 4-like [Branchiostoma belcheri]|uniref:Microfibril-associated glycoprotein 4-like n=1 Tax=Branchiostoma belcheri TaxID=7741 RepID=A0A6P4ZMN6_BRABE|nr:PREDICTED: microfibril-associated glycoprotein 4-like [Branchiostoma belcheri]